MQRHKLTGWLILFMVWIGIASINGLGALDKVEQVWRPHMADYPSLRGAVIAFQLLTVAGIVAWLYCALVLYKRVAGTLRSAQVSLLVGALLRVFGAWSIFLFGGLPKGALQALMADAGFVTFVILLFSGAWCYYLVSSERVREIYAG